MLNLSVGRSSTVYGREFAGEYSHWNCSTPARQPDNKSLVITAVASAALCCFNNSVGPNHRLLLLLSTTFARIAKKW